MCLLVHSETFGGKRETQEIPRSNGFKSQKRLRMAGINIKQIRENGPDKDKALKESLQ